MRLGALVLVGGMFVGCMGDVMEPTAMAPSACPSATTDIQARILAPSCGGVGCHGSASAALDLDLVSAGLEQRLVGATANGCGNKTLVVAGDAAGSYLLEKLTALAPTCGDRMPIGAAPLSAANLDCLRKWVVDLAPPFDAGAGTGGHASPGSGGNTGSGGGNATSSGGAGSGGIIGTGGVTSTGGVISSGGAIATGGVTSTGGVTTTGGVTATGGTTGCGPPVSFAATVQPIFTANCASGGCHAGTRPAAGLSLASGVSFASLVNVASSCAGKLLVKPAAVSESYLVNKLLGTNLCSGSQMPKAGGLSAASLNSITGWICEGAPKN